MKQLKFMLIVNAVTLALVYAVIFGTGNDVSDGVMLFDLIFITMYVCALVIQQKQKELNEKD